MFVNILFLWPIRWIATSTIINIGQVDASVKLFLGDIVVPSSQSNTIGQMNGKRQGWLAENKPSKGRRTI